MEEVIKSIRVPTAELSVKSMLAYTINLIFRVVQRLSLRVVGQILVLIAILHWSITKAQV